MTRRQDRKRKKRRNKGATRKNEKRAQNRSNMVQNVLHVHKEKTHYKSRVCSLCSFCASYSNCCYLFDDHAASLALVWMVFFIFEVCIACSLPLVKWCYFGLMASACLMMAFHCYFRGLESFGWCFLWRLSRARPRLQYE